MIGDLPVVCFDTSAHNRLVDDGPRSEPIIAALQSGLFFRFAGLSIEEMIATPESAKRAALFTYCGRIQKGRTDCIQPQNELLKLLILAHSKNPSAFDWKSVNVGAPDYERGIGDRTLIGDEELSAEQRRDQLARAKEYDRIFSGPRVEIEKVFTVHGEVPPPTFSQAIARLQVSEGALMWGIGKRLYDRAAGTDVSESTIRDFIHRCPPFRALIYAMLVSWYDKGVRDRHTGEKLAAGRNDLFISVYLPYCDQFVTAEVRGEQERCLRAVASAANLETKVLSYDDFCDSFLVVA
jgi:hypothetical protein